MTNRAVSISRAPDIVKSRWLTARHTRRLRMAFETELIHVGPDQHFGIEAPHGLVAGHATTFLDRRMRKDEGSLLVGMTRRAAILGERVQTTVRLRRFGMRVVTVRAFHGSFQHRVMVGLSKGRFRCLVAGNAQFGGLLLEQLEHGLLAVDLVAVDATHLVLAVRADREICQASNAGGMTRQTRRWPVRS